MTFRLVHALDVDARTHRLALDRLKDAMPKSTDSTSPSSLTSQQFVVLKRMTELYLKQLRLQVLPAATVLADLGDELPEGTVDLATYARDQGRRILDLLVDMYDPDAPEAAGLNTHLKLSPTIDDMVADDLLLLRPGDIDYLATIEGEYRTNKILRRIGAVFYLSKHQQRLTNFMNLLDLTWAGDIGTQDFNHTFELSLASCTALEVFSM